MPATIKPMLANAGIQYVFLGEELGGRPADSGCYDARGICAVRPCGRITSLSAGHRTARKGPLALSRGLMCSEENPAECHRNLLIGRVLAGRGALLQHIRADGRLQSQAELDQESAPGDHRQQVLFGELKEVPWRSTRSVLPKPPPPDSSDD